MPPGTRTPLVAAGSSFQGKHTRAVPDRFGWSCTHVKILYFSDFLKDKREYFSPGNPGPETIDLRRVGLIIFGLRLGETIARSQIFSCRIYPVAGPA